MKNRIILKNRGFITLFFVLGISFTFLTWISLSSRSVFDYIYIKNNFIKNRSYLQENILCADAFVNIFISSRYNLGFFDNKYTFIRSLYFSDNYTCSIEDIHISYEGLNVHNIYFILGDFGYEYGLENGFVKYIKTFNLF